jgi:hypothetical protein
MKKKKLIERAIFKDNEQIQETRFAPYVNCQFWLISRKYIILKDKLYDDFDFEYYEDIYEVIEDEDEKV